jgi:intraflagellar transport protein 172
LRADAIIQTLPSHKQAQQYLDVLAEHFKESGEFDLAEKYFGLCQKGQEALHMYMAHKMYEKAYQVAKSLPEDYSRFFFDAAKQLIQEGNLKDAERLYLLFKDVETAISMYKSQKRYQDMLRLVSAHHPDLVKETQLTIAKALESEGSWKQAEQFYVEAKDWKAAVNMYCLNDLFEDAFRVCLVSLRSAISHILLGRQNVRWLKHVCSGRVYLVENASR